MVAAWCHPSLQVHRSLRRGKMGQRAASGLAHRHEPQHASRGGGGREGGQGGAASTPPARLRSAPPAGLILVPRAPLRLRCPLPALQAGSKLDYVFVMSYDAGDKVSPKVAPTGYNAKVRDVAQFSCAMRCPAQRHTGTGRSHSCDAAARAEVECRWYWHCKLIQSCGCRCAERQGGCVERALQVVQSTGPAGPLQQPFHKTARSLQLGSY